MKYYILKSRTSTEFVATNGISSSADWQPVASAHNPPLLIPAYPDCLDMEAQRLRLQLENYEVYTIDIPI